MTKKKDLGNKILQALDEVVAWTEGKTKCCITFPGQPARWMTRAEYDYERERMKLGEALGKS